MTRIGIILGSTRPNRVGEQVATWVFDVASRRYDAEFELVDLRDYPLPHLDEPLPPSSPFYDLPNVIVTPHTSWSSGRVVDRSVELFCDNLRRYAAGEPLLNVVDPARGY